MPISTYRAPRQFLWAGLVALAIALLSVGFALRWPFAWIAAGLSLASAALVLIVGFLPPIEVYESHLRVGSKSIPWFEVRRVDRVRHSPLVVKLTLASKQSRLLLFVGPAEIGMTMLRQLRRFSREALIDGVPHKQFWGEALNAAPERKQLPTPRYPLLLPDDEAEIERMFQKLKAVGHIDPAGSGPGSTKSSGDNS